VFVLDGSDDIRLRCGWRFAAGTTCLTKRYDGYLFVAVKDACKVPEQSAPEYVPLIWLPAAFTIAIPFKGSRAYWPLNAGEFDIVPSTSTPDQHEYRNHRQHSESLHQPLSPACDCGHRHRGPYRVSQGQENLSPCISTFRNSVGGEEGKGNQFSKSCVDFGRGLILWLIA
jgi:hypothetical protein